MIIKLHQNVGLEMKQRKPKSKTYQCWQDMKQRCYNPKCKKYRIYGERGIKVCDSWLESYSNFLEDMGEKPEGYTIDRIDNSKGYSKENCRWATSKEQAFNRRTNRNITYNNKTQTITQWAQELGLAHNAIAKRLASGWEMSKVLDSKKYNILPVDLEIKQEILKRYYNKEKTQKELGKIYGIGQAAISKWVVKERKEN